MELNQTPSNQPLQQPLTTGNFPRRDGLRDLADKLSTSEGREHAIMLIATRGLTSDPALLEEAIQIFDRKGWGCDAAKLASELGDPARAVSLLEKTLSRPDLPNVAKDPVHHQIAELHIEAGKYAEALAHLEEGRYYREGARLARKHGFGEIADRLTALEDSEPARSFAEAMGRNLRRGATPREEPDPSLSRNVETFLKELESEIHWRAFDADTPRDRTGKLAGEAVRAATIQASREIAAGSPDKAAAIYESAGLTPGSAFVKLENGDRAGALSEIKQSGSGAFAVGARLAEKSGDWKEAVELWCRAGRHDLAGGLAHKKGDLALALASYEQGAEQRFARPGANDPINLSEVLWYSSSYSAAPSFMRTDKGWKSNLERAAELAEKLGDTAKSTMLYERAIAQGIRDSAAWSETISVNLDGASRAAEKVGRVEQAIELLEQDGRLSKAAKLAVKYGDLERAASSLEKAGKFGEALDLTSDQQRRATYAALKLLFAHKE